MKELVNRCVTTMVLAREQPRHSLISGFGDGTGELRGRRSVYLKGKKESQKRTGEGKKKRVGRDKCLGKR